MPQVMNVRREALRLLREAEQKDAYLSRILDGALQNSPLSERDRALLAAIVSGVTEKRVTLDFCIDALCRTDEKPGARMRMILRIGAYQLLFLDRIPQHAAVAETVALGKSPGERAFINGLLRTMARKLSAGAVNMKAAAAAPFGADGQSAATDALSGRDEKSDAAAPFGTDGQSTATDALSGRDEKSNVTAAPFGADEKTAEAAVPCGTDKKTASAAARIAAVADLPKDPTARLGVLYAFPAEVVRLFEENLGDHAESALSALASLPPTTVCINTLRLDVQSALARLRKAGIAAEKCPDAPRGVLILQTIAYASIEAALGAGNFFVQDEASQLAVTALAPRAGETGADVCACPGSKSFHAALLMENRGQIFSSDLHESKLSLIQSGAEKLGVDILKISARDARDAHPALAGTCDFVICDVPCSGLGVLAKKPDIRHRCAHLPEKLAPLGYEILCAAAKNLRPGGRLLYSTCTLTKLENEQNYHKFLDSHADFSPLDFTVGGVRSRGGCVTLLPNRTRDGFFFGLMVRGEQNEQN